MPWRTLPSISTLILGLDFVWTLALILHSSKLPIVNIVVGWIIRLCIAKGTMHPLCMYQCTKQAMFGTSLAVSLYGKRASWNIQNNLCWGRICIFRFSDKGQEPQIFQNSLIRSTDMWILATPLIQKNPLILLTFRRSLTQSVIKDSWENSTVRE